MLGFLYDLFGRAGVTALQRVGPFEGESLCAIRRNASKMIRARLEALVVLEFQRNIASDLVSHAVLGELRT